MIKSKKIFITGGAGYLGSNIVDRLYKNNDITIFSRDEAKHYFLKKKYPNINCIIGDVRNLKLLDKSSKNHDIGIFAASLKQIGAVDSNVSESNEIIIQGALNSREISENNLESACFISSDKSRSATTIYGAMKFVAGESFIVNSDKIHGPNLSTAIYGNVVNSTGSIIPLIWDAIKNDYELTLYSEEMTRFILLIEQSVDLIEFALTKNGYNVIPKPRSIKIKDLFDIYKDKFGLKYKVGVPRISEKIHEILISGEESTRVTIDGDYYLMHYENTTNKNILGGNELSSKNSCISKEILIELLSIHNYYKQY
tara:strand:- start:596 stop:1531 length:936 start_codon:yes stop_codon:yes gene_type:complete